MKRNAIKYLILVFLGFLTLKKNIHFGDYCSGMPDGIQWIFFCLLFIIAVIILIIKNKYDSKIYLIVVIIVILNFTTKPTIDFFSNKNITLIGNLNNQNRSRIITLFENKTFEIKIRSIEWSCFYKGNYEIVNDLLILKKENFIEETDSLFTYKYKIDLKNKVLIPLEKRFNTITIESINKNP